MCAHLGVNRVKVRGQLKAQTEACDSLRQRLFVDPFGRRSPHPHHAEAEGPVKQRTAEEEEEI